MAIANNNVQNVKFLRNGNLFDNHAAALSALNGFSLISEQDGTAILARYKGENFATDANDVKTLIGWVYSNSNGTYKSITIQDNEGAEGDIAALLGGGVTTANTVTMQLTALSGTSEDTSGVTSIGGAKAYAEDYTDAEIDKLTYTGVTTGTGVYVTNVTETDGIISATTAELPTVEPITVAGKPIIAVAENKGTIAASAGTINAEFVTIADAGEKFTATTVEDALAEVKDAIGTAISGLDKSDSAAAKKFVTSVSEEDGIINVSRGEITSSGKTIVLTDNADGGVNFEVNIDNDTIVQDETSKKLKVASAALTQYVGDEKTIHITSADSQNNKTVSSLLTISATTATEANVKEQYNLVNASGETIGATIKIYKDSALLSVALLHADYSDPSDPVLPSYDKATDTWTDIASPTQANQALCYAYEDVNGAVQVAAVPVGSFINEQEFASGITWDATEGKVRGVVDPQSEKNSNNVDFLTVGADGFKISGVQNAIDTAVGNAVSGLDATVTAETTHVSVQIDEVDGKLTAVTLTEDDIASADDLAELSGKTITAITSTNGSITATPDDAIGNKSVNIETDASKIKMSGFTSTDVLSGITPASSITEAFGEVDRIITENEQTTAAALNDLNTKVNTVSGDVDTIKTQYVSGVSVNGTAVTVSDHVAPIAISAATSATTATSTEAITVVTDVNGNITLGLATIDCGTY